MKKCVAMISYPVGNFSNVQAIPRWPRRRLRYAADYARKLDNARPVTAAIAVNSTDDKAARYLDIISFNRYNSWYSNPGRLDMIMKRIIDETNIWHEKHNKPLLIYPAPQMWSEEHQTEPFSLPFESIRYFTLKNPGLSVNFHMEFVATKKEENYLTLSNICIAWTHTNIRDERKEGRSKLLLLHPSLISLDMHTHLEAYL
uniref:Glycoside hydrolase family 2 catalytic domain-containing protein n=1 Tax=Glossina brevipalpis TaxID=37001 RepID=A0A1A9W7U5_9MUSC